MADMSSGGAYANAFMDVPYPLPQPILFRICLGPAGTYTSTSLTLSKGSQGLD
jgi:hypothetical protein